jgi:hypothetical protein
MAIVHQLATQASSYQTGRTGYQYLHSKLSKFFWREQDLVPRA